MNKQRFQQVIDAMRSGGLDQILITEDRALGYLTGAKANAMERVGALLIKSNGEVHSFMNKLFRFPHIEGIIAHDYVDGEDPYQMIADELMPGKVGFDDKWETKHTISILKKRDDIVPEVGSWPVDAARAVKDAEEIRLLKHSSNVNDKAIEYGIQNISEEITEKELADKIEDFFNLDNKQNT